MPSPYRDVFRSLAERELLVPYLRNALLAEHWPDNYNIEVDSSPYYGHGDGYFHPSTHSLMGARQLYYMFHPDHRDNIVPEVRHVGNEMALAVGSALHAVVQTQFVMSGLLKPDGIEVEYRNDKHMVRGRGDMVIDHPMGDKVAVEIKTINSRGFDFTKSIKPEWDAQLSMALENMSLPYGVLLMLEVGYPYRLKEFKVPRNDGLVAEIYRKFDYVREAIAKNEVPLHCCAKGSPDNQKCTARFMCWDKGKII